MIDIIGHFEDDDLPSQSLDWCKTPKTEHKNSIKPKQPYARNCYRMHKLKQMKLKPGLEVFYTKRIHAGGGGQWSPSFHNHCNNRLY